MFSMAAIAVVAFLLGALITGMFASVIVAGLHYEAQVMVDSYMGALRPRAENKLFPTVKSTRLRHATD